MERGPAGVAWVAVMVPAVAVVLSCLVDDPLGLLSMTSGPPSPPTPPPPELEDVGEPLFLTPLLEAGKIEEARRLSRVPLREEYALSYAGLFTVDKTFDSNHFVWFFPAREGCKDAPVMVWLDGGPGFSSMFGLFGMHGPFSVTVDRELVPREHTSTKHFNIAFIDNPVFSGVWVKGSDRYIGRAFPHTPPRLQEMRYFDEHVQKPYVRRALHVGNKTYYPFDGYLGKFYEGDVMRSVEPWLEEMLNNSIKVMLFNGQLDLAVPYASSEMLARSLHWNHAQEYLEAPRRAWWVEGQLAGNVQEARGLVRLLVRCSGHEVGHRQPLEALDMLKRFMTRDTFL
ncbi:probable serine carboxypeptidase CPVL [Scylla paramamosain]|uniref:probable serine carboxypeptidase CPVL n=1 Tax=Scylla paramamosain TaxID=85552 RepID=UPI0030834FD6